MPTEDEPPILKPGAPPSLGGNGFGDLIMRFASRLFIGHGVNEFLGIVSVTESIIVRIISAYFTSDRDRATYLADNIVDRMPVDRKLRTLADVISHCGWDDEFNEVVPSLRDIYKLRNALAHSYGDNEPHEDEGDYVFKRYSWRNGDFQEQDVKLGTIMDVTEKVEEVVVEQLLEILRRLESVDAR